MPKFPTTRLSLLMRARETADQAAWEEFVSIYRPVIHRFARQRGLQEADAQDLAQNVLSAVAQRLSDWKPDGKARFHSWLARIAMNQTITMYRRRKPDAGRGGTTALAVLHNEADPSTDLQLNYQREIFRLVARRVRTEFEEATWQAFWLTSVEGVAIEEAAKSLGRSVGSVYTARSRILRRFQELASQMERDWSPGSEGEVNDG